MKKLLSLGKTATSFSLIKDISALQKMRALYHGRMSHKHKESSIVIFGDSISTMEGHTPLHYPCYYTYLLCLRNGMQVTTTPGGIWFPKRSRRNIILE